jgi:crotonobetainyl-CoA:carnitine CoA-transferase CaiB-like acyl-CoA transferase
VTDAPRGILAGVRVLDFGRYIAGPFCTALLDDLGAGVIRIEKVVGSEDRHLIPVSEDAAASWGTHQRDPRRARVRRHRLTAQ